ncbi:hypothetical protein HID58_048840, partial [Brassica napus]
LSVSISKTCFFACVVQQPEVEQILAQCGLTQGTLPIRYLGVPLWTAKKLSFAGRLVLINTVIAGISNLWCATFTIPKKCIKIIHSLFGAYLWKGTVEGNHSAKVSWEVVTLAKSEGGLGIRNLVYWNRACSIKLLWLLFFKSGSIWVAWFIKNILSGRVSNLWTIKEKQTHSSATKKILRVRDYAYRWIKILPGNGRDTRFWSDNWSPFGNLRLFLGLPVSSNIGIQHSATLHDVYRNDRWRLPQPRSESQLSLHVYLSTVTLTEESDVYEWSPQGSPLTSYSTGMVYDLIKTHQPQVPWSAVVWYPRGCMQAISSAKHERLLVLLAWQASIYLLWTERNNRIHRRHYRSVSSLANQADHLIRNKISGIRETNPSLSSKMLQR